MTDPERLTEELTAGNGISDACDPYVVMERRIEHLTTRLAAAEERLEAERDEVVASDVRTLEWRTRATALATENQAMREGLETIRYMGTKLTSFEAQTMAQVARDTLLASLPPVADEREGGE